MNWKKRYETIWVGDRVKCLGENRFGKGCGWALGLSFIVTKIKGTYSKGLVYFGGLGGYGVFEKYVEKVK